MADMQSTPKTKTVTAAQITTGDLIAVQNGSLAITGTIYESSIMSYTTLVVETEAGCLYLDPETTMEVNI